MIGDCIEAMQKIEPGIFQFAEVDPPYGIDLKNLKRSESVEPTPLADYNEKDEATYAEWLYSLYDEIYVKLAPDSFAVCWFGMRHFTITHAALCHAGFTVNDTPGIWVKASGQTQQPSFNLANCYEPFFIARKGKAVLAREGRSNAFIYPALPGDKKIHPTQRPLPLIKEILTTFCHPSSAILVPFLGSGTTIRAAQQSSMAAIGWDLSETYKNAFLVSVHQDLEAEFSASESETERADAGIEEGEE